MDSRLCSWPRLALGSIGLVLALGISGSAHAQHGWPSRPIRILAPIKGARLNCLWRLSNLAPQTI